MKFSCISDIFLVLATAIATRVAIDDARRLSVTKRLEQANVEGQSQCIIAKIEDLVSAWLNAAGHSCHVFIRGNDLVRAACARLQYAI